MAYNSKVQFFVCPVEFDTDAAVSDPFTWTVNHPMLISRVEFIISELVANDSAAAVVSFDYTPVGGARTEWTTITITDASAVGACLEPATDPNSLEISDGDILHFEHKTQGTDGTASAGRGYMVIYYEQIPDIET